LFVPIAAYPIVFPLVYYLTQTSLRLRHPCDSVLALMVVLALPIFPLKAAPCIGPGGSPLADPLSLDARPKPAKIGAF
jgi:hypothetical protein